jgi:CdiI N-terminal domain
MFNLKFISAGKFSTSRNEKVAFGEIIMGDFSENFESSLSFWKIGDYKTHWIDAAQRIFSSDQTALITNLYNPETANFITWWVMWKEKEKVFVQNQILFLNSLSQKFDIDNPYKCISDRETVDDDGRTISEWEISLEDIKNYLKSNE